MLKPAERKREEILDIIKTEYIKQIKLVFGDKLKKAVLFGSYARGDNDNESDVDIMLRVDADDEALNELMDKVVEIEADFIFKYDVLLASILQNEKRFVRYQNALPFYSTINKEGIVLYEQ